MTFQDLMAMSKEELAKHYLELENTCARIQRDLAAAEFDFAVIKTNQKKEIQALTEKISGLEQELKRLKTR